MIFCKVSNKNIEGSQKMHAVTDLPGHREKHKSFLPKREYVLAIPHFYFSD
jgi:hypothetical protein